LAGGIRNRRKFKTSTEKNENNINQINKSKPTEYSARVIGSFSEATANNFPSSQIPFKKLTHVLYASVTPDKIGPFENSFNSDILVDVITRCHKHNVKVLITIDVASSKELNSFNRLVSNSVLRQKFAMSINQFIINFNLDGVDLNWLYPVSFFPLPFQSVF